MKLVTATEQPRKILAVRDIATALLNVGLLADALCRVEKIARKTRGVVQLFHSKTPIIDKMVTAALPALAFPSASALIPRFMHAPLRSLLIRALRLCPLPKHVAFIMDGNRRAARMEGVEAIRGHEKGFEALKGVGRHFREADFLLIHFPPRSTSCSSSCSRSPYQT